MNRFGDFACRARKKFSALPFFLPALFFCSFFFVFLFVLGLLFCSFCGIILLVAGGVSPFRPAPLFVFCFWGCSLCCLPVPVLFLPAFLLGRVVLLFFPVLPFLRPRLLLLASSCVPAPVWFLPLLFACLPVRRRRLCS